MVDHNAPLAQCVAALSDELGDIVHLPGEPSYETSLSRVFFPDASRRRPPAVVHPRSSAEVATAVGVAARTGGRVTVRGGGLSSNCVADDAVMLDLSMHMSDAHPIGDRVRMAGGATVGTALRALAPLDLLIPVGIVGLAGLGLVTRGGVGYLTRSVGLTLDHLVEVELALPSGDLVRLTEDSTGVEADLWWAVRGCAPPFGVVTSAVLRTQRQRNVFVDRAVVGLDALAAYFAVAPQLPRCTSMGAVLGFSGAEPVLFVYSACGSENDDDVAAARQATTAVVQASSTRRWRAETSGPYLSGLPEFAIPDADGREPQPITLPSSGDQRGWFYGKSVFTGASLGTDVADGLADAIRSAPTSACRIDFQHTGGALADTAEGATAFWGRGGEWNVPLNAIWSDAADSDACYAWAHDTLDVLAGDTVGVYSVEVRPGFTETARETELAYGDNLSRLRALRADIDSSGLFGGYPL